MTKKRVRQQQGVTKLSAAPQSGTGISLAAGENAAQGDNFPIGGSRPRTDSVRNLVFQRAVGYHTDTGEGLHRAIRAANSITPLSFVVDGKQNKSFLARGHRPRLGAISNNTLRAVARILQEQGIQASFKFPGFIEVDYGGLMLYFRSAHESYSVDVCAGAGAEWALSSPLLSTCDDVATVLAATMAVIKKHTPQ